jgi:hypothetical protein
MARRRSDRPRLRSARLSRAWKGPARDVGTAEMLAKRAYLINGSDPQLAATASGILRANHAISREQYDAAMVYAWAHAMIYGRPWRHACPLGERDGHEAPEDLLLLAKAKLQDMDGRLTAEQRLAVANLSVFGFWPGWFMAQKQGLRAMPGDERDRAALVTGLEAIARA